MDNSKQQNKHNPEKYPKKQCDNQAQNTTEPSKNSKQNEPKSRNCK